MQAVQERPEEPRSAYIAPSVMTLMILNYPIKKVITPFTLYLFLRRNDMGEKDIVLSLWCVKSED